MNNKSEVFQRVITHLETQRKKALRNGQCVYRTDEGLKCAIGCLIPDDEYNPEIEGSSLCGMMRNKMPPTIVALMQQGNKMVSLLQTLQDLHDMYEVGSFTYYEQIGFIMNSYDISADYLPPSIVTKVVVP